MSRQTRFEYESVDTVLNALIVGSLALAVVAIVYGVQLFAA